MQTTEQRLERLEKHNKRLTTALTMTVVAMAAVVTMAATGDKVGEFDMVMARAIVLKNDDGMPVVVLGATDDGDGVVGTSSAQGKKPVALTLTEDGDGVVTTYHYVAA